MTDRLIVLDASALIALLRREKGWQAVEKIIESGNAVTSPTGLAETFDICRNRKTGMSHTEIWEALSLIGLRVEPIIEQDAAEMAFLLEQADSVSKTKKNSGSLSLGDAVCLALGRRLGAVIVASDNFWEILDIPGVQIVPFR